MFLFQAYGAPGFKRGLLAGNSMVGMRLCMVPKVFLLVNNVIELSEQKRKKRANNMLHNIPS